MTIGSGAVTGYRWGQEEVKPHRQTSPRFRISSSGRNSSFCRRLQTTNSGKTKTDVENRGSGAGARHRTDSDARDAAEFGAPRPAEELSKRAAVTKQKPTVGQKGRLSRQKKTERRPNPRPEMGAGPDRECSEAVFHSNLVDSDGFLIVITQRLMTEPERSD